MVYGYGYTIILDNIKFGDRKRGEGCAVQYFIDLYEMRSVTMIYVNIPFRILLDIHYVDAFRRKLIQQHSTLLPITSATYCFQ